jgi:hypothetical protein
MIKDKYREETKKEPYCEEYSNTYGSYRDDYVHWLERRIEKNKNQLHKFARYLENEWGCSEISPEVIEEYLNQI